MYVCMITQINKTDRQLQDVHRKIEATEGTMLQGFSHLQAQQADMGKDLKADRAEVHSTLQAILLKLSGEDKDGDDKRRKVGGAAQGSPKSNA